MLVEMVIREEQEEIRAQKEENQNPEGSGEIILFQHRFLFHFSVVELLMAILVPLNWRSHHHRE